jgi:RTA1 like protein
VAPVFFSASIYTILTFLIKATGRQYSPLQPWAILVIFIVSDIVATVVQITGAASIGTAESNHSDPTKANHILTAGLAFQVFSFLVFIFLLALFLWRIRKVCTHSTIPFTLALCAATLLVYLRTCFRLAETVQGVQKSLFTHEAYFGVLEFAPIVLAIFSLNAFHPGKWIPRFRGDTQY